MSTAIAGGGVGGSSIRNWLEQSRGTIVALAGFLVALIVMQIASGKPLSYYNINNILTSAGALALAGIGETIVVIGGGLDLSFGAVISLVNVLLVTLLGTSKLSPIPYTIAAILLSLGVGGAIGLLNGLLIGFLRLQSIVVTLAMMFIVQGVVLLIQKTPGGEVSDDFAMVFVGDAISGVLPAAALIVGLAVVVWLYLKRTRFGLALYAIGSDPHSAAANGVNLKRTILLSYVTAGVFFGWAGLFLTANIGAGDPLIGTPMLLKVFAVVVLGGTAIGGGRGGCIGTIFGALTLTMIVNIVLLLGIRDYYAPIVEGVVLVVAALGFSLGSDSPAVMLFRRVRRRRRQTASGETDRAARRCCFTGADGLSELVCTARRHATSDPAVLCAAAHQHRDHRVHLRLRFPRLGLSAIADHVRLVLGHPRARPGRSHPGRRA